MAEPEGSQASLLLEGIVLRLQADLRWLEACEAAWSKTGRRGRSVVTATPDHSAVAARGLSKHYGRDEGLVRAVRRGRSRGGRGETVAVMGPSGCGKSTLLHVLGGLDRPSAGEVWLAGRRIDGMSERELARMRRSAVGFVFQAFHLMDELTALENIELPALLAGRSPRWPAGGPAICSSGSAWLTGPTICPRHCRAVNASVWPSPGRW